MVVSVRRLTLMLILPLVVSGVLAGTAFAATAPKNTSPPTIAIASGIQPSVGQTLVASPGTWSGRQPLTYTYEWFSCDYNAQNCVDTNQSGSTYAVGNADYAHDLEVQVTASNSVGQSSPVTSAPVYISSMPPQLVSPPMISGGTQAGDTLTATSGVWVTYPAYDSTFVWWDCDPTGADCNVADPSDSGNSYTLTAADVGYRVQVTVYVDDGVQASAQSDLTGIITAAPSPTPPGPGPQGGSGSQGGTGSPTTTTGTPTVTPAVVAIPAVITAPTVSGTARVGSTLTAAPGSWSANPTSYRYSWWDCGHSGTCRQIDHATATTYTVRPADTGYRIAVRVSAGNSAGYGTPAASATSATVPGPSAALLRNALTKLLPTGGVALSHGGYTSAFEAPGAGKLTVVWTAKVGGRRLTIARLRARYLRAGTSTVTIRLTTAGRRVLEVRRSIAVNARISFTPINETVTSSDREFTLSS